MSEQQSFSETSSEAVSTAAAQLNLRSDLSADAPATIAETASRCADHWRRLTYLAIAGVFFAVGVLGALLPVLPATPFLLLASYFLSKSSPRLNRALLRSRLFGPILRDWQQLGGIRRSVRVKLLSPWFLLLALRWPFLSCQWARCSQSSFSRRSALSLCSGCRQRTRLMPSRRRIERRHYNGHSDAPSFVTLRRGIVRQGLELASRIPVSASGREVLRESDGGRRRRTACASLCRRAVMSKLVRCSGRRCGGRTGR